MVSGCARQVLFSYSYSCYFIFTVSYWVEFYSRMPKNKVKRCAFVSTVEIENYQRVDKVQKGCGDYTASTDDLKRVDFM